MAMTDEERRVAAAFDAAVADHPALRAALARRRIWHLAQRADSGYTPAEPHDVAGALTVLGIEPADRLAASALSELRRGRIGIATALDLLRPLDPDRKAGFLLCLDDRARQRAEEHPAWAGVLGGEDARLEIEAARTLLGCLTVTEGARSELPEWLDPAEQDEAAWDRAGPTIERVMLRLAGDR